MTMQGIRTCRHLPALIALASAVAVAVAGCGTDAGGTLSDENRAVAARFLDELRAGRLEPAWQGSSTEFKSLMGLQSLRDYVKTHPALKSPAQCVRSRAIERDGHTLAEYVFHATGKARGKPAPATIRVLLASGDDGWRVEHVAVD